MSYKLITVLAVLAAVTDISIQGPPQTFCGRKLANTLAVLCQNGFLLHKRSDHNSLFYDDMPKFGGWQSKQDTELEFPGRGKRTGIIEECCIQPCTVDVLMTYCRADE